MAPPPMGPGGMMPPPGAMPPHMGPGGRFGPGPRGTALPALSIWLLTNRVAFCAFCAVWALVCCVASALSHLHCPAGLARAFSRCKPAEQKHAGCASSSPRSSLLLTRPSCASAADLHAPAVMHLSSHFTVTSSFVSSGGRGGREGRGRGPAGRAPPPAGRGRGSAPPAGNVQSGSQVGWPAELLDLLGARMGGPKCVGMLRVWLGCAAACAAALRSWQHIF